MYDTIIRNGTIYDGTLARPRIADIGIRGDRIAAIGNHLGNAVSTIDASGFIVTPGFIDVHNHADLTFKIFGKERIDVAAKIPSLTGNHNYAFQGVTTLVTGNCGLGYTNVDAFHDMLGKVSDVRLGVCM